MENERLVQLKRFYRLWWECLKRNEIYKNVCKNGHLAFGDKRDYRAGAKIIRVNLLKTYGVFGDVFNRSFDDWVEKYFERHIKPDTENSVRWCSPNHIQAKYNFYAMGFEKGQEAEGDDYKRTMKMMKTDVNVQSYEKEAVGELYSSGWTSIKIDLTQSNERIFKELRPLLKVLRSRVKMDIVKSEIFRSKVMPIIGNFDNEVGFRRLKVLDTYNDVLDEGGYRHIWIEVVKRIGTNEERKSIELTGWDLSEREYQIDIEGSEDPKDWSAVERTYQLDKKKAEEMILSAVTLSFPFGGEGLMKHFSTEG